MEHHDISIIPQAYPSEMQKMTWLTLHSHSQVIGICNIKLNPSVNVHLHQTPKMVYNQKGVRHFCKTCALIQSHDTNRNLNTYPWCCINLLPDMTATICTSCQMANKMSINRFLPWWHYYAANATTNTLDDEDECLNDETPQDDTRINRHQNYS